MWAKLVQALIFWDPSLEKMYVCLWTSTADQIWWLFLFGRMISATRGLAIVSGLMIDGSTFGQVFGREKK